MSDCTNGFTSNSNFTTPELNDYPPYLCDPDPLTSYSDIASRVMEEMLLTQYTKSPNLQEYIKAYVLEMDFLLESIKKVELGRYINNAVGAQLDVIGVILQQSRNIYLPTVWFGFVGASPIDGMADEASPSNGGVFRGEEQEDFILTPLDDITYRNVLLCRGYCINQVVFSIDVVYEAISTLLGQAPNTMILSEIQHKVWELQLDSLTVTTEQRDIILAVKDWFIPMTVGFNVSLVNGLFDITHDAVGITHDGLNVTHTA